MYNRITTACSAIRRRRHSLRLCLFAVLPLGALALPAGASPARAAGVDPLPAVASALAHVTSYQVTTTSTTSATGRRPTGTPRTGRRPRRGTGFRFGAGPRTTTIVAVRKGKLFEDYVVITGKDAAGKTTTTNLIVYGSRTCMRASGARSYTCRTTQSFFNLDPTVAFAQGAGSTTFAPTSARTIGGQVCEGYSYQNVSQSATAKGVVYIARTTHLPCEQDATITRRFPGSSGSSSGGSFTQKSTTLWSHFNDRRLTVPAIPA